MKVRVSLCEHSFNFKFTTNNHTNTFMLQHNSLTLTFVHKNENIKYFTSNDVMFEV